MFRRQMMLAWRALPCIACALLILSTPSQSRDLRIFAAASLANVLGEIGQEFTGTTRRELGRPGKAKEKITFSFAATSTLARQIVAGADPDIFIAADNRWMTYLQARRLIVTAGSHIIASNRLVVITRREKSSSEQISSFDVSTVAAWQALIGPGRLAVGDPAHVPAGMYAEAALRTLGHWRLLKGHLATADNVRNALVLVERGEAAAGIVYATDAEASKRVRVVARLPSTSHPPIVYPAALVAGRRGSSSQYMDRARTFLAYLGSAKARAVFIAHGFSVPRAKLKAEIGTHKMRVNKAN